VEVAFRYTDDDEAFDAEEMHVAEIIGRPPVLSISMATREQKQSSASPHEKLEDYVLRFASSYADHHVALWEIVCTNEKSQGSRHHHRKWGLKELSRWRAHEIAEVWCVAFDPKHEDVLYSGGDDAKFKAWNTTSMKLLFESSTHAGVCCIVPHPRFKNILACGSYDGFLRIFECKSPHTNPKLTASLRLNSGIWQLKWHQKRDDILLAACTTDGFKVVRVVNSTARVVGKYDGHRSLAYGCDWVPRENGDKRNMHDVASCSFYDRALHIWSVEVPP